MSSSFRIHFFSNSQFLKIVSVVVLLSVFSLQACSETKNKEKKPEKPHPIAGLVIEPAQENGVFYQLDNLPSAIKVGKREHKRILIYFTCWGCVNARKIEDRVLSSEQIQAILNENYLCFSAYTDDKAIIPGTEMTIGEKNLELQIEQFKSTTQPHFYVLDEKGKIVAQSAYVLTTDEFEAFLENGLK